MSADYQRDGRSPGQYDWRYLGKGGCDDRRASVDERGEDQCQPEGRAHARYRQPHTDDFGITHGDAGKRKKEEEARGGGIVGIIFRSINACSAVVFVMELQ